MRLVHIDHLSRGMEVGDAVYGAAGQLLLAPGVKLTDRYISLLHKLEVPAIYVADPDTAGITIPRPTKPRTYATASKNLTEAFERLKPLTRQFKDPGALEETHTAGDEFERNVRSIFGRSGFDALVKSVDAVVNDLLDQRVLVGLNSIKTHDAYTFQHSIDVAIMGIVLARRAGWNDTKVRLLGLGCMLHDLGKVLIPEELLRKPGRLTEQEYEQMKQHPKLGYLLIRSIAPSLSGLVSQVAYQHHERQDGSGYPRGLKGTNTLGVHTQGTIHDFGAMCAVADVYDAMVSTRPYRRAWAPDQVVQTVIGLAGDHLNRDAVEIFRSVVSPYPVCSEVTIVAGPHAGCRGVVAGVHPTNLTRPVVRVLFDSRGERIEPFEIDLRVEQDVVIRASTAGDELPAESMGGRRKSPRPTPPLPDEVVKALREARQGATTQTPPPRRLASCANLGQKLPKCGTPGG
jgi:HD-GYP domain-containing protein (c-di-GMP phosphodiesterase class II)